MKARAAAALPLWGLVALTGLSSTLAFVAARAMRVGCLDGKTVDLIAVAGVGGVGFGVATLVLVAGVPGYRSAVPALAAFSGLAISGYALVTLLAHDNAACF